MPENTLSSEGNVKHVLKISGKIPNTDQETSIPVNGKNLIITGPNGSGKTSFLKEIYRKLEALIINRGLADHESNLRELAQAKSNQLMQHYTEGSSQYVNQISYIASIEERIRKVTDGLNVELKNPQLLSKCFFEGNAVIAFFEANRSANIAHADKALGVDSEAEKVKKHKGNKLGVNLEQHLVNLKNRSSLAITEDKDQETADKINEWFRHFESNLRKLMEDESVNLEFNSGKLKFTIKQNNKPNYTFQSLSSGYLSIFDIYSDLLMQSEYFSTPPDQLTGIVLIDEIDAHLHVSLQRLILPFFEQSFPLIQFIITTHSPFILTSVKDAVIFDLGRNESLDADLSLYPYSSVMEGILATKTTSVVLEDTIKELSESLKSAPINIDKIKSIVEKIRPFEHKLDGESKAFFLLGENALLDKE